jgi:hypothetical protein
MSFLGDSGPRGVKVTKNPYGFSIEIRDRNPETRFLPPDPRDVRNAIRHAETLTEMPNAKRR